MNEMNKEWQDLPNMFDVCTAQADGWEIEVIIRGELEGWTGRSWSNAFYYHGRPKQPKTKTVKLLCFFDGYDLLWTTRHDDIVAGYQRVPSEDKTVEVEQ